VWERLVAEIRWQRNYFLPWVCDICAGVRLGDGRGPKRPTLSEVGPSDFNRR
jgi:hypothetical protein